MASGEPAGKTRTLGSVTGLAIRWQSAYELPRPNPRPSQIGHARPIDNRSECQYNTVARRIEPVREIDVRLNTSNDSTAPDAKPRPVETNPLATHKSVRSPAKPVIGGAAAMVSMQGELVDRKDGGS